MVSKLPWSNFNSDWLDANLTQNGNVPFSITYVEDTNSETKVAIDVTDIVKRETSVSAITLVLKSSVGNHIVWSSNADDSRLHPKLFIKTRD